MIWKRAAVPLLLLLLASCAPIGPKSIPRDRFDYNTAIADSWKEQTLLNIVKLRYADMPLFVEVASIVSGYTLESSVNLGGTLSSENAVQGDFFSVGGAGKFIDRPTITYAPITGQKFNQSFMTPIPPQSILFLTQTGWPVDMVYPITVASINGYRSRITAGTSQRPGDPEYYRIIHLFRKIQRTGGSGMRVIKGNEDRDTTILFFHSKNIADEVKEYHKEVVELLDLQPGLQEVKVTYGLIPADNKEISMMTRSMLQIMIELATQIDVPEQHVTEGRTIPSVNAQGNANEKLAKLINIHSSETRPETPFTAVNYRDYWYWIDDRDFKSKRTFAFLMILFSLTETGSDKGLPLVTIPAG